LLTCSDSYKRHGLSTWQWLPISPKMTEERKSTFVSILPKLQQQQLAALMRS